MFIEEMLGLCDNMVIVLYIKEAYMSDSILITNHSE